MQPYVILKQPGKLVFYLFTIMFLILRDSQAAGKCQNCFGPVTKLKIFNKIANGYVHINGSEVVATPEGDGFIYQISAGRGFYGRGFYLYDMKAAKFICWRRPHRTKLPHDNNKSNKKQHRFPASLVARKLSKENCQFMDPVDKDFPKYYINLVPVFNTSLKMKFNVHGKFVPQDCGRVRHRHRCVQQGYFINNVDQDNDCKCPEARRHFCRSKFAKMKVFQNICSPSNETYDS